jgi:type II secretory pathway predicted ATPase ExeA
MSDRGGQDADPFGETTDPGVYVARPASEAAVEAIARAVEARRVPALVGPPGIGKTLLLHRAAARLAATTCWEPVHLPYASLDADELCRWALGLLGAPAANAPREALLARAKREASRGHGLLLAVDEASGLTRETGDCLSSLCWQAGGGLAAILAATDDARASRALAALGPDLEPIRYTAPFSEAETRDYVAGRLTQRSVSQELWQRFDDEAVAWIHRLSAGIPRRIHEVAALLIDTPPEQVCPAWWKECRSTLESHAGETELEGETLTAARLLSVLEEEEPELWVAEDDEPGDLDLELD